MDKFEQNRQKLFNGDLKGTKNFFAKNGCTLELAYCKLLEEDYKGAKRLFLSIKDESPRAEWGYKITSILQRKHSTEPIYREELPSYFQLRNFLEVDLALFIKHGKGNFVEILCAYADIFADINLECYKFYARVFHFCDYPQFADFFAKKAKEHFYRDAELHCQIAIMHYARKNWELAQQHCFSCLYILSEYYPAEQLLSEISKVIIREN